MSVEIDVAGLREKIAHYHSLPSLEKMANVTAICNVVVNALPDILDELERLRGEVAYWHGRSCKETTATEAAEAERDAALARIAKMREWAEKAVAQDPEDAAALDSRNEGDIRDWEYRSTTAFNGKEVLSILDT